ncbi:hypothetical protein BDR26DRAFT_916625 [Obelidium mucronatum]|nr:hypothetical protein BDR26DRAFT_916625 [Obelidium mucronatum]
MYRVYWISKIRTVLKFVVSSVNYILECQRNGMKDELDELMLRGLKKSGHADWYGAQYIPDRLRHREEDSVVPPGIEFSVKGRYGMRREDSISNSSESPANSNSASEFTMSLSGSNSGSIGGGSSGGSSNGGSAERQWELKKWFYWK